MSGLWLMSSASFVVALAVTMWRATRHVRENGTDVESWLALGTASDVALCETDLHRKRVLFILAVVAGVAWVVIWPDGVAFVWVEVFIVYTGTLVGRKIIARRLLPYGRLPDQVPSEARTAFREDSVPKRPVRGRDF